jgi:hypothetical protein
MISTSQREDMAIVFKDSCGNPINGYGILDYVSAWYYKSAQFIKDTDIRVAFVSTNSLTQGEQVALLWKPLIENLNAQINFAWRTFKWGNDAKNNAAVFCVIIGFSTKKEKTSRLIYDGNIFTSAKNINPYLVDAPDIFLERRNIPICKNIPGLGIGNKPIDGGNYLFTEDEKNIFLTKEPLSERWFRPFVGANEFINGNYRFCLWLGECPPNELRKMPEALKLVDAVRKLRLQSKSIPTRKLAEKPQHFHVENMPKNSYLAIPRVSSEKRFYIPIGFLASEIIASDSMLLCPDANLYHFGILTSSVHMAWVRAVCGRLKSDYRYSKDIVYNNFIWPEPDDKLKIDIEVASTNILKTRDKYLGSTLSDLYDPLAMPVDLISAHHNLDRLVLIAYKFKLTNPTEQSIVAKLMERYEEYSRRL